jgi:hypothetical protein
VSLAVRSQYRSVLGDTPRNAAAAFTVMKFRKFGSIVVQAVVKVW